MKNLPTENTDPSIRILKTASCPSLSGKSKLTYQLGFSEKGGIQFRVTENSAAGAFNQDWFALKSIEAALDKAPRGEPVTAVNFMSLFRGMSCNTQYFIFAALKHEGLVIPSKKTKRCYDRVDLAAFLAEMQPLIDGKVLPQKLKASKKNAGSKVEATKKPKLSTKAATSLS